MNQCQNCRFWDGLTGHSIIFDESHHTADDRKLNASVRASIPTHLHGVYEQYCKRHGPSYDQRYGSTRPVWPATKWSDGCGDWESKEPIQITIHPVPTIEGGSDG